MTGSIDETMPPDDFDLVYGHGAIAEESSNVVTIQRKPATKSDVVPSTQAPVWLPRVLPVVTAWYVKAPPRREWLLQDGRSKSTDGVLPCGKVGLLIAEGGAGKTMALIQLAIAKAVGLHWLGTFMIPKPGRVLLVLGEEDAEEVHRRVFNARRSMNVDAPAEDAIVAIPLAGMPCAMIEVDERGNPIDTAFLAWLRSIAKQRGPFELIIVDPLSRFAGADAEADNAAATRFIQALESIATETGATVIVAHHTNKLARTNGAAVTGASSRGSSAIYDGVRWAAALSSERVAFDDGQVGERLGELVTFSVVKSNYSRKADPLLLRRDGANGGALLPLDDADREMIAEARVDTAPAQRRQVERDERSKSRTASLADLIREILAASPGLSGRALLATVVARRGSCSKDSFAAALAHLGSAIRTEDGDNRATFHFLAGDQS